MANPNTPIVDAPNQYIYGYQLARTGNTTLTLTSGEARSNQNATDIVTSSVGFNVVALTINGTIVGANGMARAVMAASTSYYVFVIGDSTGNYPVASLLDTSQFSPLLPTGYDVFRRVGFVRTDASGFILPFSQMGCGVERVIFYDAPVSILAAGTATTMTTVQLGASVPQNSYSGLVYLDVQYTPNGATDVAEFQVGGSTATSGCVRFGTGVAGAQVGQVCVPFRTLGGVPQIRYKVTAGDTISLALAGYTDSLAE